MAYDRHTAEQKILAACLELLDKGLIARTWGNISARLSDEEFLITPSGRAYEDLKPEELVTVKIKDHSWEGDIKPSSEKGMHAELYKLRPECDFIIHTHQTNASAVSLYGEDFDLEAFPAGLIGEDDKAILGGRIPCAKYGLSSTKTLTDNVAKAAAANPGCSAILMKHHGAAVMGATDDEAFRVADALERVCGSIFERRCGEKIMTEPGREPRGWWSVFGYLYHVETPYIMEMSRRGRRVYSYLDDMAMISGYYTDCIEDVHNEKAFRKALGNRNAVLVKNGGALVVAPDEDEAGAIAIALEKNCRAANLGLKKALKPVNPLSAAIERKVYLDKYSKLKNAGGEKDAETAD